jgi:hypothetical protein
MFKFKFKFHNIATILTKISVAAFLSPLLYMSNAGAAFTYRGEHVSQGYGLVYDSLQNITWTQFAVAGYNKSLDQAQGIVKYANTNGYYDLKGWRLPSEQELLNLYSQLPGGYGNDKVGTIQFGSGANDYFYNVQAYYWSSFYFSAGGTGREVFFKTIPGITGGTAGKGKPVDAFLDGTVWLVRPGDVGSVEGVKHFIDNVTVPDLNGNGVDEIASLYLDAKNNIHTVIIRDPKSHVTINTLTFATSTAPPLGLAAIADLNNNGTPEIAVLSERKVQIKDVKDNAKILKSVSFLNNTYQPLALSIMPDTNNNGFDELTVLGILPTGKATSETRDSVTSLKLLSDTF